MSYSNNQKRRYNNKGFHGNLKPKHNNIETYNISTRDISDELSKRLDEYDKSIEMDVFAMRCSKLFAPLILVINNDVVDSYKDKSNTDDIDYNKISSVFYDTSMDDDKQQHDAKSFNRDIEDILGRFTYPHSTKKLFLNRRTQNMLNISMEVAKELASMVDVRTYPNTNKVITLLNPLELFKDFLYTDGRPFNVEIVSVDRIGGGGYMYTVNKIYNKHKHKNNRQSMSIQDELRNRLQQKRRYN